MFTKDEMQEFDEFLSDLRDVPNERAFRTPHLLIELSQEEPDLSGDRNWLRCHRSDLGLWLVGRRAEG